MPQNPQNINIAERFTIRTLDVTEHTAGVIDAQPSWTRFISGSATMYVVPKNSDVPFPIGTLLTIEAAGGELTVVGDSGVTLLYAEGGVLTGVGQLTKVAIDTWAAAGKLV